MGSITYDVLPALRLIELSQRHARDSTSISLLRSADHPPDLLSATPRESPGSAMPAVVEHFAVHSWSWIDLNADLITCGPQPDATAENPGLHWTRLDTHAT